MDENDKGQKYVQRNMHTQESTVHKSSSTCIAAKHTSVANETPEEHNKKKINLYLSKTI